MSEETEVATNPIEDLIQATLDQNYTAATEIFNDQIGLKMQDALEQEKMGIASQIYAGHSAEGGPEDDDYVVPEDEELDLDIDDEDLEVDEDEEVDWDDEEVDWDDEEDVIDFEEDDEVEN